MAETAKAHGRRMRDQFYSKYCQGDGIDIGCGTDPLPSVYGTVVEFDKANGDAHSVAIIPDSSFDFVYSSHCLEHLERPAEALKNWWRILKPGGYLIVTVPSRDLYEKKLELPSRWNLDHKWFFVPETRENEWTLGLRQLVDEAIGDNKVYEYMKVCDEGFVSEGPEVHSGGEYQIEVVVKKC